MTTLTDERLVGEIAAEMPSSVRVFEKYNIDYCCGGRVAVSTVCANKGLDPVALLAEVEQTASRPDVDRDWTAAPLSDLIGHIVTRHHEYLRAELPAIEGKLAKLVKVRGDVYPELRPLSRVFDGLQAELTSHLMKEEMVLFPLIRRLEEAHAAGVPAPPAHCGSVNNPIAVMEHEHDSAGSALEQIRSVTRDFQLPEGACNTHNALYFGLKELEQDLHRHIHLENNILFPRAAALEAGR
jgi:regulator of cell morphogenesis and NO signaling